MIKELFDSKVGNELTELFEITKYLYDNPEIGMQEYKASKVLVDYLKKNGLKIKKKQQNFIYENFTIHCLIKR